MIPGTVKLCESPGKAGGLPLIVIRLISARKATKHERRAYEEG